LTDKVLWLLRNWGQTRVQANRNDDKVITNPEQAG